MATLPTLTVYNPNLIPDKSRMTDEEFADAIHPYLNFWNGTTIPEINNWRGTLEQIRQEINDKYIAVKNQAVDGGYSQAYLDTKYNPPMQRIYYVDAVNGDDTNDGSSGSPFKTIKKAIDSVPVGGTADIYLKEGQDFIFLDYFYTIKNKYVRFFIDGDTSNKPTIHLTNAYINNKLYYYYASLVNSIIVFYHDLNFVVDNMVESNPDSYDGWKCFFRVLHGDSFISAKNPTITLKDSVSFVMVDDYMGASLLLSFNTPFLTLNSNYLVKLLYGATASIKINNTSNVDDANYLVAGVIRDADGKPRNILSNIVL